MQESADALRSCRVDSCIRVWAINTELWYEVRRRAKAGRFKPEDLSFALQAIQTISGTASFDDESNCICFKPRSLLPANHIIIVRFDGQPARESSAVGQIGQFQFTTCEMRPACRLSLRMQDWPTDKTVPFVYDPVLQPSLSAFEKVVANTMNLPLSDVRGNVWVLFAGIEMCVGGSDLGRLKDGDVVVVARAEKRRKRRQEERNAAGIGSMKRSVPDLDSEVIELD